MIEKYGLSSFVAEKREIENNSNELIKFIIKNKKSFPKLFFLISDTAKFCENHFNDLLTLVRREKRQLGFQTPNRINFNHEYTIAKNSLESDFYYLFTPSGRLDWLTISVEGEKVSIADKGIVKNKIQFITQNEINNLKLINGIADQLTDNDIISILYENLTGLPCFIEYNKTESLQKQQSIIISIEYFESITSTKNRNLFSPLKKLLSPILEKKITYRYLPLSSNYNSWLYLNSPENFEISCQVIGVNENIEKAKTNDPEIASYVIKGNGSSKIYLFEVLVTVPESLKTWYHALYYMAIIYVIGLGIYFFDKLDLMSKFNKLHFLCLTHNSFITLDKSTISNISLAIIGGIIATRGWLIIEENVLKNISIKFTYLMILLVIMTILINYF